jgi:hypothetical protein
MRMILTGQDKAFLEVQLEAFRTEHYKNEIAPIHVAIRSNAQPPSIKAFSEGLERLSMALAQPNPALRVDATIIAQS